MKRRDFLRNSTLAGATTLVATACTTNTNETKTTTEPAAADDVFELNELTIDELQQKMVAGTYSSEQLTNLYLQRIAAIDKSGPTLNSVIELNPDAGSIAKQMDAERKAGKLRGPLHGIPVLIKDNIDTADKMMTTAGSLALAGHVAIQRSGKASINVHALQAD